MKEFIPLHFNIAFTDANDTTLFTTVVTVTHSQLGVRDQRRFKSVHMIPVSKLKSTDFHFSNVQDMCTKIVPDQL